MQVDVETAEEGENQQDENCEQDESHERVSLLWDVKLSRAGGWPTRLCGKGIECQLTASSDDSRFSTRSCSMGIWRRNFVNWLSIRPAAMLAV